MHTLTFNLHSRSYAVHYRKRQAYGVKCLLYENIDGRLSHLSEWFMEIHAMPNDIIARAASFITLQKETVC